jgi:hypothetical protein
MVRSTMLAAVTIEKPSSIQYCPLAVEADSAGLPVAIKLRGEWVEVKEVLDRWVIDDEWIPGQVIRRMHWECLMSKGLRMTVFEDIDSGRWYW